MNTESHFWNHLEDSPTDDAAKLALADLLSENGKEELAFALKWCVKMRVWPAKPSRGRSEMRYGWNCSISDKLKEAPGQSNYLPRSVFYSMWAPASQHLDSIATARTLSEAVGRVGKALKRLRQLVTLG